MFCDLHTHSVCSDGSYTPAELICAAKELGLTIALTDHNTVTGLPEFMAEAEKQGVTAIAGIEFSTIHEGQEFHLVGLFLDSIHYPRIEQLMARFHVLKEISNVEMIRKLNQAGFRIDYDAVKRRNRNGRPNRAHIAAELMDRGYVSSIDQAFDTLIGDDCPFYVPCERLETAAAIRLLREMKAVPILAHPLKDVSEETLGQLLPGLIDAGLVAMETQHCTYDDDAIAQAERIAREYKLLQSGGSDFHGIHKPDVRLGCGKGNLAVPVSFLEQLQAYRQAMM